ncbi:MAG: 50S ribosomal protein L11 methyltransferase [Gammaproteobacteria bacterium]
MSWKQLTVTTPKNRAEAVSDLFSSFGAVSVTYMDAADEPVYEPDPGETRIWNQTDVIGLFDSEADLSPVKSFISGQFEEIPESAWRQESLEDEIWERKWLEHYRPMLFGDRLWVCPSGQEKKGDETVSLILDPGLAFGTGTHATTALCLEWLATNDARGKTLVDYGCGSGILAIAALLLGARQAHAIDIDPQALTATRDNAQKNGVLNGIRCYFPERFPDIQADIIVANILAHPLIELAPRIGRLVKPGGSLVLSGILTEQSGPVIEAYRGEFDIKQTVAREEWCRIEGTKT